MQNCTQAKPLRSVPFEPFSTLSTVNEVVCCMPSQVISLRWLCHHAAATFEEPSRFSAAPWRPERSSLAETQSVSPLAQLYLTFSVALLPLTVRLLWKTARAVLSVGAWAR